MRKKRTDIFDHVQLLNQEMLAPVGITFFRDVLVLAARRKNNLSEKFAIGDFSPRNIAGYGRL
jgi:hypothetical protein